MSQTVHLPLLAVTLLLSLLLSSGCSQHSDEVPPLPESMPEITTDYLLKHRIISYAPKYHEKVITTLPYEIQTFDENYLLFLVARLPDANSTAVIKITEPHYYLWLERRSESWRDFVTVYSRQLPTLTIKAHYSSIRNGKYYKDYTIDFTLQQLHKVQENGFAVTLVNKQNHRSTIELPKHYIEAFVKMLELPND